VLERTDWHGNDIPPAAALDRLGAALVGQGHLSEADLARARSAAAEAGERLDRVLSRLGLVAESTLADALAAILDVPRIHAADFPADPPLVETLGRAFLADARILPLDDGETVRLATGDPLDRAALAAVAAKLGRSVEIFAATPAEIAQALDRLAAAPPEAAAADTDADIARLRDLAAEAPVIKLVNQIIQRAAMARASDIHIDAHDRGLRVRLRVDGALHDIDAPPADLTAAIVSRLKIMARLNIAEQRLPQDGRIRTNVAGRALDLRVATLPTLHGENVVLRLLDRSGLVLDLPSLGFDADQVAAIDGLIRRPNGIVLVTGPTGSGKTTTLYAALAALNAPEVKIVTIEDPVEYEIAGISQIQVKPQIGLDFAQGLRAILRHNPDVIMVGEIRDRETAEIAVQAALTGHLVLSTLHTNSAAAAIDRLRDMGIEEYLITATLAGVVAQRLVRRLCPDCAVADRDAAGPGLPDGRYARAPGCRACHGSGARGRVAVAEILAMDARLRRAVLDGRDLHTIECLAAEGGLVPMHRAGLAKAAAGEIALADVMALSVGD